jgi:hypothetical protein
MSIEAANVAPSFAFRRSLVAEDLRRLSEPCVIFEGTHTDSDGVTAYLYTVGGWLDGQPLADGCTVSGEVMLIHAGSRDEADYIARMGLHDTILALDSEEERYQEASAALARLSSVGRFELIDQATKPAADTSDAFVRDTEAIRPLIGDDIVLAAGRVEN